MDDMVRRYPGERVLFLAGGGLEIGVSAAGAALVCVRADGVELALPMQCGNFRAGTYAGCTVGPVAGRIAGGLLAVDGVSYTLAQNEGTNTLHGGPNNLSAREWRVDEHDGAHAAFSCALPDGENGFPGARRFTVTYALTGGALQVTHRAVSDKPTVVSLTNHAYWNLSGDFSKPAAGHMLTLPANDVWHNDAAHLPLRRVPVAGTVFDFRTPRPLSPTPGDDATGQLANACGYNNAFVLSGAPAVTLTHAASGRTLVVETDYPALQLYSGGYLGPEQRTATGVPLAPGCAFAFEPQFAPNALPVLRPGAEYCRRITFRLS